MKCFCRNHQHLTCEIRWGARPQLPHAASGGILAYCGRRRAVRWREALENEMDGHIPLDDTIESSTHAVLSITDTSVNAIQSSSTQGSSQPFKLHHHIHLRDV